MDASIEVFRWLIKSQQLIAHIIARLSRNPPTVSRPKTTNQPTPHKSIVAQWLLISTTRAIVFNQQKTVVALQLTWEVKNKISRSKWCTHTKWGWWENLPHIKLTIKVKLLQQNKVAATTVSPLSTMMMMITKSSSLCWITWAFCALHNSSCWH